MGVSLFPPWYTRSCMSVPEGVENVHGLGLVCGRVVLVFVLCFFFFFFSWAGWGLGDLVILLMVGWGIERERGRERETRWWVGLL